MRYIFLVLIAFSQLALAKDISVALTVNNNAITMEDQIEMEIQVSGTQSASEPSLVGQENFTIEGAGSSSQIQIINGATSVTKTFQYVLLPKREGTFTLGPASVMVDGKEYKSEVVEIKVAKGNTSSSAAIQGKEGKNYFIESVVDKSNPFVNEQFVYTFRLYTRTDIQNASLSFPEFKDFWKEKIGDQRKYEKNINGQIWQVIEISYLLTGLKPGKATIEEARLIGEVLVEGTGRRDRRHSVFDQFFGGGSPFGERKRVQMIAKAVTVDVRPLPEPKPVGFSGVVGNFSLTSEVDKKIIKKGESVTQTFTLKGIGSLDNVSIPSTETADYKIYDDKPTLDKKESDHGVIATKIFKRALVPKNEGRIEISPLKLVIFDPSSKLYKTLETTPIILMVEAGDKDDVHHISSNNSIIDSRKKVEILGHDLMPIKYSLDSLSNRTSSHLQKIVLLVIIFLLPLIYVILAILRKKELSLLEDTSGITRKSKAAKAFIQKFKNVNSVQDAFILFKDYLGNKLNVDGRAITQVDLERLLNPYKVSSELIKNIKTLFDTIESMQYGGGSLTDQLKKNILEKIQLLFESLEKEIR
ncbi:MAG: BatD family protein [Bacteriovoracaceae bacterium]